MGVAFAFVSAIGFSLTNIFIRKGIRPGDADNGLLITLVFNVVVLSTIVAVLGLSGNLPAFNVVGFLWFVAAGFLATFLGRNTLFAGIRHVGASRAASRAKPARIRLIRGNRARSATLRSRKEPSRSPR